MPLPPFVDLAAGGVGCGSGSASVTPMPSLFLMRCSISLATAGFFFYVSNFGKYNATYGALAGVIVLLLWLYIVNAILLFGAEVDAELERVRELQAGMPAERDLQLPVRDTKASDKRARKYEKDMERAETLRKSGGRTQEAGEAGE